jgi:hypothetical protein
MFRRELVAEISSRAAAAAGGTGGPAGPPPDPFSLRSDLWPPAGAITFTKTDFWDSPAAVGTNDPAGLVLQLQPGNIGIIRSFSQYVNDMTAADALFWQIIINGAPAFGWEKATMFPTLASFRTVSDDPFLKVPRGAEIRIRISNAAPAIAHKLGASYSGWQWPEPGNNGAGG